MTDPYTTLGQALAAAAHRQETDAPATWSARSWLSHRLNAAVMVLALVLTGGAIAVAATGLLDGKPVKEPEGIPTPNSGDGVPVPGGSHLLGLRAADPEGGLPWGMRLVRTTRGVTCVQIGRVHNGQLGQLGIDGVYHDDGRFHPLSPDILPNFGGYASISCILPGQTVMANSPTQDRNAGWMVGPRKVKPTAQDLRSIAYGLLGPHAVSITYKTATGTQTRPVAPGNGAYMIVQPVSWPIPPIGVGGLFIIGWTTGHRVSPLPPTPVRFSVISAVTYRFGPMVCAVGSLPPGLKHCPATAPAPEHAFQPLRSLNESVHVTVVAQSHTSCAAAFLLDPCYRAAVEFKAPYTVTNAAGEYDIAVESSCHNARPNGWAMIRDIKRGEMVRTLSAGYFRCTSIDKFEVRYLNRGLGGPSPGASHESVIVGTGTLGEIPGAMSIP